MSIFKAAPKLIREARPLVRLTERFGGAAAADASANAFVLDARRATAFADLSWVHEAAFRHSQCAAFRKPGGRVVVLRKSSELLLGDPAAAAVSEGLVGFAKSLAQENGGRGATVNVLCDASTESDDGDADADACEAPLEWLLSHESTYVTGQELVAVQRPPATLTASETAMPAALVTGAARGIGRATAELLRRQHPACRLVLVDHPTARESLAAVAAELDAASVAVDVTDAGAGEALAAMGVERGGFGAVLHAAGVTRDKTFGRMEATLWAPVIDINLSAVCAIDTALLAVPGALSPLGAGFVCFGSTSGVAGNAGQSNYATAKSGLMGYAKARGAALYGFACEEGAARHRFACVAPGFIVTEMTGQIPWLTRAIGSRLNSLGQGGTPEDVAAAVAFLASPRAAGLQPGSVLRVCGQFRGGR